MGRRSTSASSGTRPGSYGWPATSADSGPRWQRLRAAALARTRACTGDPASSPWNSPSCHWRVSCHSGSNRRAFEVAPRSASVTCGSSRVQLVTDDVVGTPVRVRGSAGSPPAGMGKRRTVRVLRQVVTDANTSEAATVRGWSPGGSDSGTLQVPWATCRSVGGPPPTWSWTRGTP